MNYAMSFLLVAAAVFITKVAVDTDSALVLLPAATLFISGFVLFVLETGDRVREYLAHRAAIRAREERISLIVKGIN